MTDTSKPIGVFDSGIGGLSIQKALLSMLPFESFVYFSDAAHAPYGERGDAFITHRCFAVTEYLLSRHHIRALVVACNTATTVAIRELRQHFRKLPIIGVEPAIKPAAQATQSGHIAVLATERTLQSEKYQLLRQQLAPLVLISDIPCPNLAAAIEYADDAQINALCCRYLHEAIEQSGPPVVDTVVLGCTHYPLIKPLLQELAPPGLRFVDSALAVARQTVRRLSELPPEKAACGPQLLLQTSGCPDYLAQMAARYLGEQFVPQR